MQDFDDEHDPDLVFGGSNQDDIDSDDDFLVEVNNLYDPDLQTPGPQEIAVEQEQPFDIAPGHMLSDLAMESFENNAEKQQFLDSNTMLTENDSLVPDENAPLENGG